MKVALLALALAGCLDSLGPEVGAPLRPACTPGDSDPTTIVHFDTDIRTAIFARPDVHCTRCHTPTGATPIGVGISGLDLSSYASLRTGGSRSGANIVVAGDPCTSILVQKLGEAPPFGERMPLNGPPYLSDADLQRIQDWISEGANDN